MTGAARTDVSTVGVGMLAQRQMHVGQVDGAAALASVSKRSRSTWAAAGRALALHAELVAAAAHLDAEALLDQPQVLVQRTAQRGKARVVLGQQFEFQLRCGSAGSRRCFTRTVPAARWPSPAAAGHAGNCSSPR